ncbi:MAG: hypothetical protein WBG42_10485 [Cryomorphaceae bacterium]
MRFSIPVLLYFLFIGSCHGQYSLTYFDAEYTEINNGLIPEGVAEGWDYPEYDIPLGFEFTMGQNSFDTLLQDGLGASLQGGSYDDGALFGYIVDIMDPGTFLDVAPSEITYSTSGSEGNQICKIQYKNVAFVNEVGPLGTAENRSNFQIWFYESDFSIEIRFGLSNVTNPTLIYEGFEGPTIGLFIGFSNDGADYDYGVLLAGNPVAPVFQELTPGEDNPQLV